MERLMTKYKKTKYLKFVEQFVEEKVKNLLTTRFYAFRSEQKVSYDVALSLVESAELNGNTLKLNNKNNIKKLIIQIDKIHNVVYCLFTTKRSNRSRSERNVDRYYSFDLWVIPKRTELTVLKGEIYKCIAKAHTEFNSKLNQN